MSLIGREGFKLQGKDVSKDEKGKEGLPTILSDERYNLNHLYDPYHIDI